MRVLVLFCFFFSSLIANTLQEAINQASPYSTIKLQNAIYKGNIVIDKPLTLIGRGENVIIEGDYKGSVITITASEVTLQNLKIRGSGKSMQAIDAAVSMHKVRHCKISECIINDTLYGIDMDMVNNSIISHNFISSNDEVISLRGNGLKLYYSHHNQIINNRIQKVKDITLDYSNDNILRKNEFVDNRFATHIALSKRNTLQDNIYRYNSVAMMFMGTKDTKVLANRIESSKGAAGIAVMIGAVSHFVFKNNIVRYNAKALYIDGKEKEKGIKRFIENNEISYNGEAFHFHATVKDNKIVKNRIFANIEDVVKDISGTFQPSNIVEYNYWDRYAGFDKDDNGIGDTPYEVYQYADQLWHYNKKIKFFYASPIMTLLNFLSQLAPFIEPNMIMQDKNPLIDLK